MNELGWLLGLALLAAEFWQRRRQAELAERLIRNYCRQQGWQCLSVARTGSLPLLLLALLLRKPTGFSFEYSEDGVLRQQGELYLTGLRMPIFRLPEAGSHGSQASDNKVIPFPGRRVK